MKKYEKDSVVKVVCITIGVLALIAGALLALYSYFKKHFKVEFECDGDCDLCEDGCFEDEETPIPECGDCLCEEAE